jgi:outer membrane putative beta-barrel porin/alpha-amylase
MVWLGLLAGAQDLDPRAYSPAPVGTNFATVTYGRTTGSVLLDPTIPVTDSSTRINTALAGYYHAFGLFGRQTSVSVGVPYVWGTLEARVNTVARRTYRSGVGDPRLRLAFFLMGSPALTPEEFKKHKASTVLGASLTLVAPLGQYDPNLLINIGANRWAFLTEMGLSHTFRSWILEVDPGCWFFHQNSNFFRGQVREQAPIGSVQGHVIYTFRPGLWLALDGTYYTGGRTHLDGIRGNDLQQNSRLGVTMALPLTKTQSLKFVFNRGAIVRVGGDFTTASVTYQLRWNTRR